MDIVVSYQQTPLLALRLSKESGCCGFRGLLTRSCSRFRSRPVVLRHPLPELASRLHNPYVIRRAKSDRDPRVLEYVSLFKEYVSRSRLYLDLRHTYCTSHLSDADNYRLLYR